MFKSLAAYAEMEAIKSSHFTPKRQQYQHSNMYKKDRSGVIMHGRTVHVLLRH